jgi:hypothetical protein
MELSIRKDDPTMHLRLWLREVGLHTLEYPVGKVCGDFQFFSPPQLIELDRMPSLAGLKRDDFVFSFSFSLSVRARELVV